MRTGTGLRRTALAIAVVIVGLAIAQAISHHSLEPIWQVGWIPAVLVGSIWVCKPNRCAHVLPRQRS